jgi:hypothetical protein
MVIPTCYSMTPMATKAGQELFPLESGYNSSGAIQEFLTLFEYWFFLDYKTYMEYTPYRLSFYGVKSLKVCAITREHCP